MRHFQPFHSDCILHRGISQYSKKIQKRILRRRRKQKKILSKKQLDWNYLEKPKLPSNFIFPYDHHFVFNLIILVERDYGMEMAPIQAFNRYKRVTQIVTHKQSQALEVFCSAYQRQSGLPVEYVIKRLLSMGNGNYKKCAEFLTEFKLFQTRPKSTGNNKSQQQPISEQLGITPPMPHAAHLIEQCQQTHTKQHLLDLLEKYKDYPIYCFNFGYQSLKTREFESLTSIILNETFIKKLGYEKGELQQRVLRSGIPNYEVRNQENVPYTPLWMAYVLRLLQGKTVADIFRQWHQKQEYQFQTKDNRIIKMKNDFRKGDTMLIQENGGVYFYAIQIFGKDTNLEPVVSTASKLEGSFYPNEFERKKKELAEHVERFVSKYNADLVEKQRMEVIKEQDGAIMCEVVDIDNPEDI